jgi:UbiD family decarboxylase
MKSALANFIEKLDKETKLVRITKPVSLHLEAASILKELDGKPMLFERMTDQEGKALDFPVAANLFSTRELVAEYLGTKQGEIVKLMGDAIERRKKPELVPSADFLEVQEETDFDRIPALFHYPDDGGRYFSSAIVVAHDKELGRNCSFHRMMLTGKNTATIRILKRHLDEFIRRAGGELEVAVVVGAPINFMLASATSVELGVDEMEIANALAPIKTVKLKNGIEVPADAEFVFEAKITKKTGKEGKFVDLTETYDIVREQPVIEFGRMYRRKDAIFQALLPGGLEHKILMGMPREPTIFREVGRECECTGVNITPGGCSWLHAVVGIRKKKDDDGRRAIEAAFKGHKSLKHVVIVDGDINIYDPAEVEWAIATRAQADKDVIVKSNEKGSSLDPSADPHTYATSKAGIDATKPLIAKGKNYSKAKHAKIDLKKFMQ